MHHEIVYLREGYNMTKAESKRYDKITKHTDFSTMSGVGEEWKLDRYGNVIAIMIDGQMQCRIYRINSYLTGNEVTKIG